MTWRTRKKIARRYLDTGVIPAKYVLGIEEYFEPENRVWKETLVLPGRISGAIYSEAFRRGWDGCHWDDPLLLSINEAG